MGLSKTILLKEGNIQTTVASIASCQSNRIHKGFYFLLESFPIFVHMNSHEWRQSLTKCALYSLQLKEIQRCYMDQCGASRYCSVGYSKMEDTVYFQTGCSVYADTRDQYLKTLTTGIRNNSLKCSFISAR